MDVHDVECPVGIAALSCEPEQSELDRDVGMVRQCLRDYEEPLSRHLEAFERIVERLREAEEHIEFLGNEESKLMERLRKAEATLHRVREFVGGWNMDQCRCGSGACCGDHWWAKLRELMEGEP
jgi:predicted nuclease with TOPRIM domain